MAQDLAALAILLTIIGLFAYTHAPKHWQTPLGFLLITFGWAPLGVLAVTLLKHPLLLVPAAFVLGAALIPRRSS